MKKNSICTTLLLITTAGFLMTSCATVREPVTPKKSVPPPKTLPKLGVPTTKLPAPYHAHGAVRELTAKARRQMNAGNMDHAFSTLERAIKIDPSDPVPWHMLAGIQLKKGNMDQAEQMARKSNLLAKNDKTLRRQNWLIIAEALKQKGFNKEAEAAKHRAGKY
jgi:predicted Zn-dependent protease